MHTSPACSKFPKKAIRRDNQGAKRTERESRPSWGRILSTIHAAYNNHTPTTYIFSDFSFLLERKLEFIRLITPPVLYCNSIFTEEQSMHTQANKSHSRTAVSRDPSLIDQFSLVKPSAALSDMLGIDKIYIVVSKFIVGA